MDVLSETLIKNDIIELNIKNSTCVIEIRIYPLENKQKNYDLFTIIISKQLGKCEFYIAEPQKLNYSIYSSSQTCYFASITQVENY